MPIFARAADDVRLASMVNVPPLGVTFSSEELKVLSHYRVVRLGVMASSYEPLEQLHNGVLKGISVDYMAIIGATLGVKLEVQVYPDWSAAIDALRVGEVDVLGHGSNYEEQLPGLILSHAYVENRPVLVAREKVLADSVLAPLQGPVAIEGSYTSLAELRTSFPQLKPILYPSIRAGLHALAKGAADKFIGDEVTSAYQLVQGEFAHLRMRPLEGHKVAGYGFVFRQDNEHLRDLFDRVLARIPEITRASILNYWGVRAAFGESHTSRFTTSDKTWLAQKPTVRVAVSGALPPLSFYDENGDPQGLFADLLAETSYYTGLHFTLVPVSTLGDLDEAIRDDKVDMTMLLQPPARLKPELIISQPFMQSSFTLVGPQNTKIRDLTDLRGKRVAISTMSMSIDWLTNTYPDIDQIHVEQPLDALAEVASGNADAALLLFPLASYLVDQYFSDDLRVLTAVPELDARVSFAVRKDLPQLSSVLAKSIDYLGPGRIGALVERWRSVQPAEKGTWSNYVRFGRWLSLAGGVAVAILLIWLVYAYVRRHQLRSEADLQAFRSALLDGIPQSIVVRDLQGRFVLCNQAFYKVFDLLPEQVLGCRTAEFQGVDPEQAQALELSYFALLSKAATDLQQVEMRVQGELLVLRQWSVPYSGRDGRIAGLIMGWIDMTASVQLLQQLSIARDQAVEASAAKSHFLAVMSHEIRTPLNAIIGLLELTMRRVDQGEGWDREAIEVAYSSSHALLQLIGDILDLAKIESGKLTLEPFACNPQDVLDSVVRVFYGVAREKGLYLRATFNLNSRREVMMDAGRLKQVLSNLLSNAIKFTDQGGVEISLAGNESNGRLNLVFDVVDTGIGISLEDQARLFEPFSQAQGQASHRGGTGLGLVICRQLVEMMGGTLSLESIPRQGTKLHVELSVPLLGSAPKGLTVQPVAAQAQVALKVLLVDDHPANRLLLGQQLRFLGHLLREAEDGAKAFALVENEPFDVIITDVNMPIMNGYELARKVRIFERGHHQTPRKIIGFTANAQAEERQRCLEAGMDECLFKPVGLDKLEACLGGGG